MIPQKGQLLVFKAPPFFDKEYLYQVTASGDKVIRADLYHSPRVKKNWTQSEFLILMEHEMIRFASESDVSRLAPKPGQSQTEE